MSVIHSIRHFHSCVREYGPMFNYSTFSFESTMGLFDFFCTLKYCLFELASFARTIHGGFAPTRELIKNIDLYRQSALYVSSCSFPASGKEYVNRLFSPSREVTFNYQDALQNIKLHQKISPPLNLLQKWPNLSQTNILFYKTLFIDRLRFSADDFTTLRRSNDACILYKSKKNSHAIGFILCVLHFFDKNEIYLLLNKVKITSTADTLDIHGKIFQCDNILQGFAAVDSTVLIQPSQISQKLAFRPTLNDDPSVSNTFVFCKYPNLKECS